MNSIADQTEMDGPMVTQALQQNDRAVVDSSIVILGISPDKPDLAKAIGDLASVGY